MQTAPQELRDNFITVSPGARRYRRARAALFLLGLCILSMVGAAFIVTSFGARTYQWQAFQVGMRLSPAWQGQTRVVLKPLGEIRAATHQTPVLLTVSLESVSFERMKALVLHPPDRAALERDFRRTAQNDLRRFSLQQILLGALGGLLAPLLLHAKRARLWLLSALAGGGFISLLLWGTLHTYNQAAFADPTYTGSLRQAPLIVALAKDVFYQASAFSDKLRNVADNLGALYGRINAVPTPTTDAQTVRVLHISDIHNNPAAVGFVRTLADNFHVQAVIDTGDLSDFGLPVETRLSQGLARLPMPYVFVAGNHDSQAIVKALAAHPRTVILNGQTVDVAGLRILGSPDPSSLRPGKGSVDTSDAALDAAGAALAADVSRDHPDIVCVHNPRQANAVLGRVPLVLCGHLHRAYVETHGATVVCNAGTTGGAGLRYFDRREGVPFSAALLTFTRPPHPRLLSIDTIVLDGSLSQYSLSRRTFGSPNPPSGGTP